MMFAFMCKYGIVFVSAKVIENKNKSDVLLTTHQTYFYSYKLHFSGGNLQIPTPTLIVLKYYVNAAFNSRVKLPTFFIRLSSGMLSSPIKRTIALPTITPSQ